MTHLNPLIPLVISVLGICSPAPAAITLESAYRSALEKTEGLRLQQARAEQAGERVAQVRGRIFPQLGFLTTYTRVDQIAPAAGGISSFQVPDQWSSRLNLVQPIFHGLGEWAEMRARRRLERAETLDTDDARLGIYAGVAERFYALLAAERDVANVAELVSLTERRVADLAARAKIGRSRRSEWLSALAQKLDAQAELEGSRGELAGALSRLTEATGLDPAEAPRHPSSAPCSRSWKSARHSKPSACEPKPWKSASRSRVPDIFLRWISSPTTT